MFEGETKEGWVEVICGPMFAGKTEEFIRRLQKAAFARHRVQLFRPKKDTRSGRVKTHANHEMADHPYIDVHVVESVFELDPRAEVVGVDEAQLFKKHVLLDVVQRAAAQGKRVVIAGCDRDYMGRPFGGMKDLIFLADEVVKLHAACSRCHRPATYSERLSSSRATVVIGDEYEPRCKFCHTYVGAKMKARRGYKNVNTSPGVPAIKPDATWDTRRNPDEREHRPQHVAPPVQPSSEG